MSSGQANSVSQPNFLAARPFSLVPAGPNSPGNPRSIALGDFNGDGKSDMAVANYSSPTVSVIISNGDGTFGLPSRYNVGSFPRFVLTRDFNGDGNLDLAVVNSNKTPGLSILLGDGMGGFGSATGFSAGASPNYAAAADFNNDGKLDLAIANAGSNDVSILLGDGNGNFSSPMNIAVGLDPLSVATGDFNGDSKPDLAVTNFNSGNVQVLLGNGSGGFGAPLNIATGANPIHVLVRDLNGDGKLDLVVANHGANTVSVLMGNGTGGFASPKNFATDLQPCFIAAADLNGDGNLDLAVADDLSNDVTTLLGDGSGNFAFAANVTAGPIPQSIAVGDFNADGRMDLAVVNSNSGYVWILTGKGDGDFLRAPGFSTPSISFAAVAGDFNNDGKADLATANFRTNNISVLLGDGAGGFGPATNFAVGSQPHSLAIADFNHDGKVDLVVGNNGANNVSVLLGDGAGGFGAATTNGVSGPAIDVATGDFNGDGKDDVAVAANGTGINAPTVSILLGDGTGSFATLKTLVTSEPCTGIRVGDFNADGKSDMALITDTRVSIVLGIGTGNFAVTNTYLMMSNDGTPSQISSLAVGDLNGDGKVDLAVSIALNLSVLSGKGDGTFEAPVNFAPAGAVAAIGDFNGDGKADLALGAGAASILTGDGLGSFGSKTTFAAGPAPASLVAGDFNGDGKLDLAAPDVYVNGVFILLNQTGSPAPANLQFSSGNYSISEGDVGGLITVTRSGDTSTTVSVDYSLSDMSAEQRSDYSSGAGTLTFAPGETSKTFPVLVVDDAYVEGNEMVRLALGNLRGNVVVGSPGNAVLTIVDNDSAPASTNPDDDAQFFVRQHYYDFLSRAPDPSGFTFWTGQITQCGSDQICIHNRRVDVSNAFFYELEYQQTGSYVYRLYRAAFGNDQPFPNPIPDPNHPGEEKKVPAYAVFAKDRARVVGGSDLAQLQKELASTFTQRPEFLAKYPSSLDGPGFVDALLATIRNDIGVDLVAERATLIALYNAGGRGAALYRLADDNALSNPLNNRAFIDAEYNRAFVATQYFGYLRRDPDMAGFLFWFSQVSSAPLRDVAKQHAMVCSFTTSAEYQQRFSAVVTHFNSECQ